MWRWLISRLCLSKGNRCRCVRAYTRSPPQSSPDSSTLLFPDTASVSRRAISVIPQWGKWYRLSSLCSSTDSLIDENAEPTGYIDIEARHLFFYFFESRNDPDKDDVVFWTNGCSGASMSLFMELGMPRLARFSSFTHGSYQGHAGSPVPKEAPPCTLTPGMNTPM